WPARTISLQSGNVVSSENRSATVKRVSATFADTLVQTKATHSARPPAPPGSPLQSVATSPRQPRPRHREQGRILPQPADDRHRQRLRRLEERGPGVDPIDHHPPRLGHRPEPCPG